ncbi:MAG: peptidoglycan DD-metalloendopeptidase family protein [Salibacteraceae bacterium]
MEKKHKLYLLLGAGALALFSFFTLQQHSDQPVASMAPLGNAEIVVEPVSEVAFGIRVDTLHLHQAEFKPNQFLADVLLPHHISYPEIDRLVKKAKPVFDVRKLAAGKKFSILTAQDSTAKAHYFIYESSATQYVVFDLRDTMRIYKGEREVEVREATSAGVIQSSLYESLLAAETSPALAMELANMYAWSVDFYRIQKGDRFKVIYEQRFVEGEFIGVGAIKAAVFQHKSEDFYGFYYQQDSLRGDYYDEKGNSLRKAFLQAPLKYSRISSGFSRRRFHPVQKRYKSHLGTDYAAPKGTPIMSVGDGTVVKAGFGRFNGNYVKIRHNGTYSTQYLHMSKIASGMKPGRVVRQGEVIGYVGSTGLATGPHVCFRFWKNGKQVNHRAEKLPASKPIQEEYKADYLEWLEVWKPKLDQVTFPEEEQLPA